MTDESEILVNRDTITHYFNYCQNLQFQNLRFSIYSEQADSILFNFYHSGDPSNQTDFAKYKLNNTELKKRFENILPTNFSAFVSKSGKKKKDSVLFVLDMLLSSHHEKLTDGKFNRSETYDSKNRYLFEDKFVWQDWNLQNKNIAKALHTCAHKIIISKNKRFEIVIETRYTESLRIDKKIKLSTLASKDINAFKITKSDIYNLFNSDWTIPSKVKLIQNPRLESALFNLNFVIENYLFNFRRIKCELNIRSVKSNRIVDHYVISDYSISKTNSHVLTKDDFISIFNLLSHDIIVQYKNEKLYVPLAHAVFNTLHFGLKIRTNNSYYLTGLILVEFFNFKFSKLNLHKKEFSHLDKIPLENLTDFEKVYKDRLIEKIKSITKYTKSK